MYLITLLLVECFICLIGIFSYSMTCLIFCSLFYGIALLFLIDFYMVFVDHGHKHFIILLHFFFNLSQPAPPSVCF